MSESDDEGQVVERVAKVEVGLSNLREMLYLTIQDWKDKLDKHTEAEEKNFDRLTASMDKLNVTLSQLVEQNMRWKSTVAGALLVLSAVASLVWYIFTQLGFSIVGLFNPTGK